MNYTIEDARNGGWGPEAADFVAWLQQVDQQVKGRVGVSIDDLPDQSYADAFNDGTSAEDMATEVIESEFGEDEDSDEEDES